MAAAGVDASEYMSTSCRPVRDTDVSDRVKVVWASIAWSMSMIIGDIWTAL